MAGIGKANGWAGSSGGRRLMRWLLVLALLVASAGASALAPPVASSVDAESVPLVEPDPQADAVEQLLTVSPKPAFERAELQLAQLPLTGLPRARWLAIADRKSVV